ncbi:Retrovirus-related Pol polyprotein from transposon gypsy, partial [Mucuna pruriens]
MSGLDTTIVGHRPPSIPNANPIQQWLRGMKLEVALKIEEEVEKHWNAGFLAVAECLEWVANIVPIPKKNGKPKDNFPLPHINMPVDNTAQHSYSFTDEFFRYTQIWMSLEDKEKITFITTRETFYYKDMPFRLKNVGVTYQRAMVTLFHHMMHKKSEVYMDGMIAKSRMPDQHYEFRLNSTKCTFGVKTKKLLGFIVNESEIEVNPDKVKAIQDMTAPKQKLM